MTAFTRRTVVATALLSLVVGATATACGKAGGDDKGSGGSGKKDRIIGLLLPENATTRYEKFDRPRITAKVKELCPDCTVDYANAAGQPATQAQQISSMVAKGVKVLILDSADAKAVKSSVEAAVDRGMKVVAYDRLAEGPVSAYVSYDNEKVGELQGHALLDAMGPKAVPSAKIVMIDGDPADPNAADFKKGAHSVLDGRVNVAYEQSGLWKDTVANQKATAAITSLGAKNIAGVYSANDSMAGGIATALKGAGINPPLTGQDAELPALQRMLAGRQSATIYKPASPETDPAAEIAVDLLNGKPFTDIATSSVRSTTGASVPAKLLPAVLVTKDTIKDTVMKDQAYTVAQLCTAAYTELCRQAGIR
jgi:D-xylose transport system substrate-binding protein